MIEFLEKLSRIFQGLFCVIFWVWMVLNWVDGTIGFYQFGMGMILIYILIQVGSEP